MTEPELTAAQEGRVRRLLADARHGAPMPPEVVARLDGVLRDLADERADGPAQGAAEGAAASDDTVVVSLDAARRRRWRATGLLVAAVAVAAVGIGVPSFVRGMSAGDDAAGGTSASSADEAQPNDAPREAGGAAGGDDGTAGDGDAGGDTSPAPEAALAGIPSVAASSFRRDAIRLADTTQNYSTQDEERSKSAFDAVGCARPDAWGEGDAIAVLYADQPALLLFREPSGGLQEVDLFVCDSTEPELSTQIPAP